MKPRHLLLPALLLSAPAHACVEGLATLFFTGLAILVALLGLSSLSQLGLMRLSENHRLSTLGKVALLLLSTLHLMAGGMGIAIGSSFGIGGLVVGLLLFVPVMTFCIRGYRAI